MDTETLAFRHDRHLDALMDAANDEAHANAERDAVLVAQQSADNWQKMVDQPGFASELIGDWTADPQAELAEIYRELAKVKAGLVCIADAARIVFRNIDRRVDEISQSQVEKEQ